MPTRPYEAALQTGSARKLGLTVAVVTVLLVLMAAAGIWGTLWRDATGLAVRHSGEVRVSLTRVLVYMQDVETGQRGYLLTGDKHYLEPYERARAEVGNELLRLQQLTSDNPLQQERIDRLDQKINAKLEELAETIAVRDTRGFDQARAIVVTNQGKQAMDDIRAIIADMDGEESLLYAGRTKDADRSFELALTAGIGTALLGLLAYAGFVGTLKRNLHLQTVAVKAINDQRELLRVTLSSIGDGVITTDVQGRVVFLNTVAQFLTGWGQEEAQGRPLTEVFKIVNESTRRDVDNPALRALREGAIVGLANHTLLVRRDGSETPIDDSAAPIRDRDGESQGAVLVFRDISDRKLAENTLREGERRKDEFLATLAHELRNPLAPLRNALYVASAPGSDHAAVANALQTMERQVAHMVRLVDDLMDVARITRGKLELRRQALSVQSLVRQALEACAPLLQKNGHEVAVALPPQAIYVEGDVMRLTQVLCNLIGNADKFTPPGGHIAVSARAVEGGEVSIAVKDDGIGIPQAMMERVFDLFSQVDRSLERERGGLGIGLSLARRITDMHGGALSAASAGEGKGSEFTLLLPTVPAPAETPAPAAAASAPRRALRILIADDNRDAGDSLATLLTLQGHTVSVVYDGEAAVEAARREQPQAVLLDIGMPRLNGYEAARRIRALPGGKGILLVALTGWGQDEDRRKSAEAGFDSHLVKPVEPAVLERVLADAGARP